MRKNNGTERLRQADGVIWDLDNTLYRFNEDFSQACQIAAARAAIKNGAQYTLDEAVAICIQSFTRHGNSSHIFIEDHKINQQGMHADFHDFLDETVIHRSLELAELFRQAALQNIIVTHASQNWARRILNHLGLSGHFPGDRIIAAEDVAFQSKASSRVPFERALDLLGLAPDRVVVVEDSAQNLRIPHEMGLTTVLLHYGQPPVPMPDHVHMDCNNAADFLKTVIGLKTAP